ncbi:protein SCAI isoform X2 [Ananas comosus]|uniref:Protein SCAI isoform X2 n=1 Tax=Ananas comosus TaxID=4615 RepID=A0A6P5H511_ANACO|nr:protein SCAI isoform X2 [Ananas comosus]
MAQSNNSAIPITEQFWSLVDKADRRFSRVRDRPSHDRNRDDGDFHKAFKLYTRLWKMQQEHRAALTDAGMRRWEVGEIASRIAQLYYGQYRRTSDSSYLAEAFVFYEAVLDREYLRDAPSAPSAAAAAAEVALAHKQLRLLVRFLNVSLILGRREMVLRLASLLRIVLEEHRRGFQETEYKEWKHVVQEVVRFLKADTPFMNMRPLRYSFAFDPPPDTLPSVVPGGTKRSLALRDAVLCSYYHNEVKIGELTLDTFRMLQCLEWDPCGMFSLKSGADGTHSGMGLNSHNLLQDIRDPSLPLNPRKLILYRPSITHFLMVLATMCEELPHDGILLIYLSAADTAEKITGSFRKLDISSPSNSPVNSPPESSSPITGSQKINNELHLWLGSHGSEGSKYIYPCDLVPFTRRPLFLVIDSKCSHAFKAINGSEKGETAAMLLSPISRPPTAAAGDDSSRSQNGSQFTMFLTAPLQAFCFLIGISGTNIDKEKYVAAEKLLSLSLKEWETTLVASDALHPVWIQALGDPFLRRFILRFIFCRASLALFKLTNGEEEFLPGCTPQLPESLDPDAALSQSCILRLANFFNAADQFAFTEGIARSSESDADLITEASDVR